MMDRRRFLRWLGGTAAGAAAAHTLDLDKLLWVPGDKTIFLPPHPAVAVTMPLPHSVLQVGDVFTIGGKYGVNPLTFKPTQHLQLFTVVAHTAYGVDVKPLKTRETDAWVRKQRQMGLRAS